MRAPIQFFAAVLACLLLFGCSSVEATFERASVRLPVNVFGAYAEEVNAANGKVEEDAKFVRKRPVYAAFPLAHLGTKIPAGTRLPVIVYFHGCGGILRASIGHLRWLANLDDFVVIAPDSFARDRREYCFRYFTVDLSYYRQVTNMRWNEIHFALDQIAQLPWVNKDNIFLMGHSQGGGMVAGYNGGVKIRARIILNGACGVAFGDGMQDDEALLTFDTGRDPWFRNWSTSCREFVLRHPKGKSIWVAEGSTHDLAISYWPTVKAFLTDNRH